MSASATLTIYPTALKARAARRASLPPAGVLLGSAAVTFPELTDALARQLGVTGRILPPELAALVLEAAVSDLPDVSGALGGRGRGLLRELQSAIDELKAARIGPAELREAAAAAPGFEAALRIGELARIYQAYERRLAQIGALDRHGREWEVAERLAECVEHGRRPPLIAAVRRLVFAEVYDFSVLQFLIATALMRLVGDAELVAFAHPENVDATRFLDRTWNRFVTSEAIAEQVLPSFVVRGGRQGSLAIALRGVFTQPSVPAVAGDASIRVLAAPHRYGEVEAVLRDVRRRLEGGADPERLAIVARDLGPYAELLENVADRFGVPLSFRRGTALLASGAVRETIGLVRCALEGLPRIRLAAIVDSDYFRFRSPRAAGWLEDLGYVSEAVSPLDACLARAENAAKPMTRHRAALGAVVEAVRGLDDTRSFGGHMEALRATLRRLGFRPVAREALDAGAARRDARAWQRFDELLDAMAGVARALGSPSMGVEEFLTLVLSASEGDLGNEPASAGGVRALSILDARGLDFDVVYVLGLDDGTFPAPRRESAVLPDAVKRALGGAALGVLRARLGERAAGLEGALLRTAREASLEDPFLFFLALSMAEREIVLSYPTADERGNATVRSPFIDEVEACFIEPLPLEVVDATALVPRADACCEAGELVARAAADRWRAAPGVPDELTAAVRMRLAGAGPRLEDLDRRARLEAARLRYFLLPLASPARTASADGWVGVVPADAALRARIDAAVWSPTRLEALAACGFKFFSARLLGLKDRDEAGADVSLRDRGTLLHRAIEVLLGALRIWPGDPADARRQAHAVLEQARSAIEATVAPKDRSILDVEWRRMLAVVDGLVEVEVREAQEAAAAGLRREQRLEWPFEFEHAAADGGVLRLAGKADRVDLWWRGERLDRLRVRDYKSARDARVSRQKLAEPDDDVRRLAYQLPVYLDGARRAFGADPAVALEGGYWSLLAPPRLRDQARVFPVEEIEAAERDTAALVASARGGRFDVAPTECDEWCAFRTVCRYQPPPLEDEHG